MKLDKDDLEPWIIEFFKQADNSVPVTWFLPYVADNFHMHWTPNCEFDGPDGFVEFYRNTTSNMLNRVHHISDINIESHGDTARITFAVHETAEVWHAPMPRPLQAIINATFEWLMEISDKTGEPVITKYTLTSVDFPAESVVVEADRVFKDYQFMHGPFSLQNP